LSSPKAKVPLLHDLLYFALTKKDAYRILSKYQFYLISRASRALIDPKAALFGGPQTCEAHTFDPPQKACVFLGTPGNFMQFRDTRNCIKSVKLAEDPRFSAN